MTGSAASRVLTCGMVVALALALFAPDPSRSAAPGVADAATGTTDRPAVPARLLTVVRDGTLPSSTAPGGTTGSTVPALFTTDLPDARVQVAIDFAMGQLGVPYVWGGDGPASGEGGFDCSGLTTAAYAAAGIGLPRTAHTQFHAGPHVPPDAALQPGDLVFYSTPDRVHHVGMYLGAGRMVNAPRRGKPVQVALHRWPGDDYLGATRPAAQPGSLRAGYLYTVPVPAAGTAPAVPEDFVAPPATLPPVLPPTAVADLAPVPVPVPVLPGVRKAPPVGATPAPTTTPGLTSTPGPTPTSGLTSTPGPTPTSGLPATPMRTPGPDPMAIAAAAPVVEGVPPAAATPSG